MARAISRRWRGTDGDHRVILATATLSRKTSRRVVTLALLGVPEQTWKIDLPVDPDPTIRRGGLRAAMTSRRSR